MARIKNTKGRITSIQYVHDPEAAKEWMNLFMEITKKKFIEQASHKNR